jgi:hypothetical protein
VYSSVIAPKAWQQICRSVNFEPSSSQPFRTRHNQQARDSFAASGHADLGVYGQQSTRQVKRFKTAIGAPNPIVGCRLIYKRIRQAESSQGMSTRAIRFSVEASTNIDGAVLGATASIDRTPDPLQMKRIAMST